jgi:hypothetical protein
MQWISRLLSLSPLRRPGDEASENPYQQNIVSAIRSLGMRLDRTLTSDIKLLYGAPLGDDAVTFGT